MGPWTDCPGGCGYRWCRSYQLQDGFHQCGTCTDPAFRERQHAEAQGRRKLHGPGKELSGGKRPAKRSGECDVPEPPPGIKRTRFTRKARKRQAHASAQAGTREQDAALRGQSSQAAPREPGTLLLHTELEQASQANPQVSRTYQAAPEPAKHFKQVPEATELQRDTQGAAAEAAGGASKQVASGLELGLMAGLLPLQQGSKDAEPARTSLEEAAVVAKDPAGQPAYGRNSKSSSGRDEAKPLQSTSQQSSSVSYTSTGTDSLDSVQKAQKVEDSKERQRQFMERLQRKVQDQKQQAEPSSKPCLAALLASAARKKKRRNRKQMAGNPRESLWEPPQSPFGLIEEQLFGNPWKLLVACILLNKTSVVQVRKIIWKLFELMPTPEAGMHVDEAAVRELIQPLGLAPKRAPMLIRFCRDYVEKQWMDPKELHGVGQYGADAYNIFCRGDWRSVSPTDKDLLKYHQWLTKTNGEGAGLLRETEPRPEPQLGGSKS